MTRCDEHEGARSMIWESVGVRSMIWESIGVRLRTKSGMGPGQDQTDGRKG